MAPPAETTAAPAPGPAADALLETLRAQAARFARSGSGWREDPLGYAWLSCLEAADAVGRALDSRLTGTAPATVLAEHADRPVEDSTHTDDLQEAFAAARGAAATVRFSLFGRRRGHRGETADASSGV